MLTARNASRDLKAHIALSPLLSLNAGASAGNVIFTAISRAYIIRSLTLVYQTASTSTALTGKSFNIGILGSGSSFITGATATISTTVPNTVNLTLPTAVTLNAGDTLTVDSVGSATGNTGVIFFVAELTPVENTTAQGSLNVTL